MAPLFVLVKPETASYRPDGPIKRLVPTGSSSVLNRELECARHRAVTAIDQQQRTSLIRHLAVETVAADDAAPIISVVPGA